MRSMWILWLSCIWIVPLLCGLYANEAKFKKNIVVGVTFPYTGRNDENVTSVLKAFKRDMWLAGGLLILVSLPLFFVKSISTYLFLWLLWIDIVIIVPSIVYILYNKKLKELKKEKGWVREDRDLATVRLETIPSSKRVSLWTFVPAVVISLIPILFRPQQFWMWLVMALITALCYLGYRYTFRNKAETVDNNVTVTKALTQIRKYNWAKAWLLIAYMLAFTNLIMALLMKSPLLGTLLILIMTAVFMVFFIRLELSTRRMQEELTKDSGTDWYVDEDDYWLGGMFYYNPNDSRFIVNNRVGMNTTINLATMAGKVCTAILVLFLLIMPFTGFMISGATGKPIDLEVTDTTLTAMHGATTYDIKLDEVQEVKLLEELPDGLVKTMGTNWETLFKGDFSANDIGAMKVIIDPTVSPYLLIQTKDGRWYLLSSRDAAVTRAVYEKIKQ